MRRRAFWVPILVVLTFFGTRGVLLVSFSVFGFQKEATVASKGKAMRKGFTRLRSFRYPTTLEVPIAKKVDPDMILVPLLGGLQLYF